jgi:alkanesulfonate monooxygenase SsuD/methylene tetrahydromethanopterin reductase-like flavin-dependent oxidoreductase (luciferase family)
MAAMRRLGFLSFGHWQDSPHSATRTAADALRQSIELAVAAEQLGLGGAFFRVHHFARQLASPFRSWRRSAPAPTGSRSGRR